MERRTFLKTVAAGGAAALNFLYPGLTNVVGAASGNLEPAAVEDPFPERDPNFAGGRVVEKTGDGIILAAGDEIRAVRMSADALVWKEFEGVPHSEILLGDYMDVRGTALADGTLLAKNVWINIGRTDGKVDMLLPTGLQMMSIKGVQRTLELSKALEVVQIQDGKELVSSLASLVPGTTFGAVGLLLPDGGFRATRIWIWPQA